MPEGEVAPEPPEEDGNRNLENATMLGFLVALVAAGIWCLARWRTFDRLRTARQRMIRQNASGLAKGSRALDIIYLERDRTQNRIPFLLIALWTPQLRDDRNARPGAIGAFL
jgi:hypothetical protein